MMKTMQDKKKSKCKAIKGQSLCLQLPLMLCNSLRDQGESNNMCLAQIVSAWQTGLRKIKGVSGQATAVVNSLSDLVKGSRES